MPNDLLPADERIFYVLAATLIPVLLFGGVAVDRSLLAPYRSKGVAAWFRVLGGIIAIGTMAMIAEVCALYAAIHGTSPAFLIRIAICLVLVCGMVLVVAAVGAPWIRRLARTGTLDPTTIWVPFTLIVVAAAIILASALGSAANDREARVQSVRENQASERTQELNRDELETYALIADAYGRMATVLADLREGRGTRSQGAQDALRLELRQLNDQALYYNNLACLIRWERLTVAEAAILGGPEDLIPIQRCGAGRPPRLPPKLEAVGDWD